MTSCAYAPCLHAVSVNTLFIAAQVQNSGLTDMGTVDTAHNIIIHVTAWYCTIFPVQCTCTTHRAGRAGVKFVFSRRLQTIFIVSLRSISSDFRNTLIEIIMLVEMQTIYMKAPVYIHVCDTV